MLFQGQPEVTVCGRCFSARPVSHSHAMNEIDLAKGAEDLKMNIFILPIWPTTSIICYISDHNVLKSSIITSEKNVFQEFLGACFYSQRQRQQTCLFFAHRVRVLVVDAREHHDGLGASVHNSIIALVAMMVQQLHNKIPPKMTGLAVGKG